MTDAAPLSAAESATAYVELALLLDQWFVATGVAATEVVGTAPAERVALAVTSRRVGEAAAAWRELVPESALLAPLVAQATAAADSLGSSEVDVAVLSAHVRSLLDAIEPRLRAHADGAAQHAARELRALLDGPDGLAGLVRR